MAKQFKQYADRINALSLRERAIITLSVLIAMGFLWWNYFALGLKSQVETINKGNQLLTSEIDNLQVALTSIQRRIREGVHKSERERLATLQAELERVNQLLEQKTLALIEPDQMFELMQELIFSESKLELTGLKRKEMKTVFEAEQADQDHPRIYRHVMQMSFQGKYRDVLNYIVSLENLEWKLLWDKITLTTTEYPMIQVDIEISTLSDNQYWVGL